MYFEFARPAIMKRPRSVAEPTAQKFGASHGVNG